jgi:transposase
LAVERDLCEFDRLTDDLRVIERDLARSALADERVKRLMTIPGIDMVVALAPLAAIGDVERFEKPEKVGYLGLNPSIRQSEWGPAYHGRITKQGRGHARGMLVEAGWGRGKGAGPAAQLLFARANPARAARRRRRNGAQAHHPRPDLDSLIRAGRQQAHRPRLALPRASARLLDQKIDKGLD